MSQVKKIIVDSRYFSDNAPAGKGTFELSEIVEVHGSQVLYLESFQCVNSWFTIDDSNCNLYILEEANSGVVTGRIAQIVSAPYDSDSFGQALQDALNNGRSVSGSYSVIRATSNASSVGAVGNAAFRFYTVNLTGGGNFSLPDTQHLRDPTFFLTWLVYGAPMYDRDFLRSSNDLVEFLGAGSGVRSSWTSTYVDLRAKHSICLHSADIGNGTSMGPRGIRTCIAVIPVLSGYGQITYFQGSGNVNDFIEPATKSLKRMSFEIQSVRGDTINMQGGHWIAVFVLGCRP